MYNPQKVIELLESGGYRKKELLDFIGKNWNGSVDTIIKGDIRVSKLEKIADFFGVPVDTFFDREYATNGSVSVSGVRNRVHNFSVGVATEANVYKALLEEKDKRIAVLEDLVNALKNQIEKH